MDVERIDLHHSLLLMVLLLLVVLLLVVLLLVVLLLVMLLLSECIVTCEENATCKSRE